MMGRPAIKIHNGEGELFAAGVEKDGTIELFVDQCPKGNDPDAKWAGICVTKEQAAELLRWLVEVLV